VRIDFHPSATAELEASADWYAERSLSAVRGFAWAADAALHKIAEQPNRFPRIDQKHRSCNLGKFPFQIIFYQERNRIIIIAIAHAKRRPGYWIGRQ